MYHSGIMSENTVLKILRPLFFLFCSFGCLSALSGQNNGQQNEIQNFISNNIPVNNQNWEISQSPVTGYLYFANSSGLVEFNGISSSTYNMPYSQSTRSVYVNSSGRIFTGSFEDFGYWEDKPGRGLVYNSLAKNIIVPKNDEIWNILENDGSLFFQSFTTIYRLDSMGVKAIHAPSNMLFMFSAGDKLIVQCLGLGLFWFDGSDFHFINSSEIFGSIKVHAIIGRGDGIYWICTANNGIYRFDGMKFSYFDSEISTFMTTQTCNAGLAISDSQFVFGTISNGIVFCDINGKVLKNYNHSNGLNNNTVLSLFRDNNNGLWVGLDEGVNYLNTLSPSTIYINSSGTLGTIYSIIHDSLRLYIGTNHGLFKADISGNNQGFTFSGVEIIPHTQGQVWTLEKFDNQIICGHNDGTFLIDNNNFRQICSITGGWCIREYNDLLIEGTYTGIVFFKKDPNGRWIFRNRISGFSEPTRHIEVDYLGYIWASHPQKGIYKLELNESLDSVTKMQYFDVIDGKRMSFDIYKINNQVVFTNSENIFKFDYDQKTIIPFLELNRTLEQYKSASQIIPYNRNNYWFIREDKIALFELSKDFSARKLIEIKQKFSDLPERELQIIQLGKEHILIPTRQAFITYNLSLLEKNKDNSRLRVTKLIFQGNRRSFEVKPAGMSSINIPYYSNNLRAYISDPSQFDQENKEYQYRLPEIDSIWYSTTQDNFTILNLPYGKYRLQVKSDNSSSLSELAFSIDRPWYLANAAFLFYFLILTGLLLLTVRVFRGELKRQKQLIEFEIINTRLASELDFKSYELMLTMRYMIQKNETLTKLNEHIGLLKEQTTKIPQKSIREMERIINHGLDEQTEEWKNAMNSLKLSQQGFFKRLIDKHSNLTPNDLRLCSYLRMNFATKDIARLLNISGRAVEISRYRLRRKMNLEHNINLTEYLIKEGDSES
jgi:DNA-binding NarL/FixJ family response regulator